MINGVLVLPSRGDTISLRSTLDPVASAIRGERFSLPILLQHHILPLYNHNQSLGTNFLRPFVLVLPTVLVAGREARVRFQKGIVEEYHVSRRHNAHVLRLKLPFCDPKALSSQPEVQHLWSGRSIRSCYPLRSSSERDPYQTYEREVIRHAERTPDNVSPHMSGLEVPR